MTGVFKIRFLLISQPYPMVWRVE